MTVSRFWSARRIPPINTRDRGDEGRGRTALVTGASSGIGRSFCALLAARQYDVVAVARREERLIQLKKELEAEWGITVHPLVADLSDPAAPEMIAGRLREDGLSIDLLVNNAGYGMLGRFAETDWQRHEDFLRVMGISYLRLTHLLLPHMIEQRWGRIINVASIAGTMSSTPMMTLYSATKALVHKFTEGLAAECAPYGVHCTASLPGLTGTEIFGITGIDDHIAGMRALQLTMLSPDTVARQAYRACERGKRMIVHGASNKPAVVLIAHTPRALRYWLSEAQTAGVTATEPS
jgi:short-subunit dehydrogenase